MAQRGNIASHKSCLNCACRGFLFQNAAPQTQRNERNAIQPILGQSYPCHTHATCLPANSLVPSAIKCAPTPSPFFYLSLCTPLTVVHTHVARRSSPVHMLITVSFGISACLCTRAFSLPHCSFAISLSHCCSSFSLLHALRYVRMRSFYLILLR